MASQKYLNHAVEDLPDSLFINNSVHNLSQSLGESQPSGAQTVHRVPTVALIGRAKVHPFREEYSALASKSNHLDFAPKVSFEDIQVPPTQKEACTVPSDYYEAVLFDSTRIFTNTLKRNPLSFRCIAMLHPTMQMKKIEKDLSDEDQEQVTLTSAVLTHQSPQLPCEYHLFVSLLDLCAGLMAKWGVFHSDQYCYRNSVSRTSLYDPCTYSSTLLSIDTFWLAIGVRDIPLCDTVPDSVISLGKALEVVTIRTFDCLLGINTWSNGEVATDPVKLRLPTGLFALCRKPPLSLQRVKANLIELERTYRTFERAVMAAFSVSPQGE